MTSQAERRLFVDIETFSSVDITKAGAFKYVESPDFEILLIAYAWDDGPVQVMHVSEHINEHSISAEMCTFMTGLWNPEVVKVAHNSAFERAAFAQYFGRRGPGDPLDPDAYCPPEQWEDTMILAAYNGLPMSLDAAGAALQLPDQKMKEGKALINYFCKPCKPTITNKGRTRNLPENAPEKWATFCEYCKRDVEVTQTIYYRLASYPVTDFERQVWALDARINERGVLVDMDLAQAALDVDEAFKSEHLDELTRLTGLDNPNSVSQLKDWLDGVGLSCDSLNKASVADLKKAATDPTTRRVLELRSLLGKTSTKKYEAMVNAAGADHRVRGITQYYGAGRTGRWAGRLVQLQNLPQNHLDAIHEVREIVRAKDLDTLELLYDSVPDVLSQLIRTALVAKPGHTFLVSDYAAIEARVIAYLAGEQWRLDVFAQGGDIYCSSASQMFKVPVVKHGVNGHLRQKGKVAELACGYGGGVAALKAFGADKMGLTEEEMQTIVTQWRAASPTIPKLWRAVEQGAKRALERPGQWVMVLRPGHILGASDCVVKYRKDADALRCLLPSGRILTYWGARLDSDGSICFMGQNQTTRKWEKTGTWGGKLVENIVQAVARDCLALAMVKLDAAGYDIVFHVHDEVVIEAPDGSHWQDAAAIMGEPIDWAPGLLLRGDGYETKFYMKD
jgi:DNA polymerase